MPKGPLAGLKLIEFGGIGPAPFCGMLLSDLGADVVRIDRKTAKPLTVGISGTRFAVSERGRRSIALDLKNPAAVEACLKLIEKADGLLEGFRPGVMERLGLGPEIASARNPRLVYGRMSGWGQSGPYSQAAGHDLNYIAISGALAAIGPRDKPIPPLNLVGDFGGAVYLAFGILAGVLHARETGQGQVIDCAMSDCAASMMAMFYGFRAMGVWRDERQSNLLDGGAHFYNTYECADGLWVSIASLEPQFYALLLEKAGLVDPQFRAQMDPAGWPVLNEKLARVIRTKTRQEWCALMEGTDACFAPVLSMQEAPQHPHNVQRGTFAEVAGVLQPTPTPRFSVTPGAIQGPPPAVGADNVEALTDWGFSALDVEALSEADAL